jgi:predicted RNA-binding protein YlqC (UPF0109 family)
MSETELAAKLDAVETQQKEILRLLRGGAAMRVSYTPDEFGKLIGYSGRWVREQVAIGTIAKVKRMKDVILIPASEVEHFRSGRAALV